MKVNRAFRYRLEPTPEQCKRFEQFAGVCRLVYNLAWEQRRDWWRLHKANTENQRAIFGGAAGSEGGRWASSNSRSASPAGPVLGGAIHLVVSASQRWQPTISTPVNALRLRRRTEVRDREYIACGHEDNADVNAAKEILRRSTAWQGAEGQTIGPLNRQLVEHHHA